MKNKFLLKCLVTVFLGCFGIHKFMEKKNIIGILYLFTFGLYGIGWAIDSFISIYKLIVNHIKIPNKTPIKTPIFIESNYLFEELIEDYALKYKYEKNIAGVEYRNLNFSDLKNNYIDFQLENSEFDNKSIKLMLNNIHLGYIYQQDDMIRDMIFNYLNNSEWKIVGWLKKIDESNKKLSYQIAFYKKLNDNDSIFNLNTNLTKISKKSEDYLSSRYDNLSALNENDIVLFETQSDSDLILVTNSFYEEIGELSEKASTQLLEYTESNCILIGKILEIIEKDNGSLGAKINIKVFRR